MQFLSGFLFFKVFSLKVKMQKNEIVRSFLSGKFKKKKKTPYNQQKQYVSFMKIVP